MAYGERGRQGGREGGKKGRRENHAHCVVCNDNHYLKCRLVINNCSVKNWHVFLDFQIPIKGKSGNSNIEYTLRM